MIENSKVWHPFSPIKSGDVVEKVVKAKDATLYLDNGKTLIDAISSWWVTLHGHSNEQLAKILYNQAKTLEHVIFAGFTHDPAEQIAEKLVNQAGPTFKRAFFSDNGSTAVEVAIKLAVQYWENKGEKRTRMLALDGGYHGDTFGAMSVARSSGFYEPFDEMLFEVDFVPFPKDNDSVQKINQLLEQNDYAAFICEPLMQGAAGMRIYEPALLNEMFKACKAKDVVVIADEVLTGFYRTGKFFASHYLEEAPDLISCSKGITGGFMPLGLTLVGEKIVDVFNNNDKSKAFYHGHSYTGNPLACALASKSYDMLVSESSLNNISRINQNHLRFKEKIEQDEWVKSVKVLGTVIAINVSTNQSDAYFNSIRDHLYNGFIQKGLLLRPLGNTVYVLPPYCITNEELATIYKGIEEVCTSVYENHVKCE